MRDYRFEVTFKTGIEILVTTSCEAYARILAQAEQIDAGNDIRIEKVEKLD